MKALPRHEITVRSLIDACAREFGLLITPDAAGGYTIAWDTDTGTVPLAGNHHSVVDALVSGVADLQERYDSLLAALATRGLDLTTFINDAEWLCLRGYDARVGYAAKRIADTQSVQSRPAPEVVDIAIVAVLPPDTDLSMRPAHLRAIVVGEVYGALADYVDRYADLYADWGQVLRAIPIPASSYAHAVRLGSEDLAELRSRIVALARGDTPAGGDEDVMTVELFDPEIHQVLTLDGGELQLGVALAVLSALEEHPERVALLHVPMLIEIEDDLPVGGPLGSQAGASVVLQIAALAMAPGAALPVEIMAAWPIAADTTADALRAVARQMDEAGILYFDADGDTITASPEQFAQETTVALGSALGFDATSRLSHARQSFASSIAGTMLTAYEAGYAEVIGPLWPHLNHVISLALHHGDTYVGELVRVMVTISTPDTIEDALRPLSQWLALLDVEPPAGDLHDYVLGHLLAIGERCRRLLRERASVVSLLAPVLDALYDAAERIAQGEGQALRQIQIAYARAQLGYIGSRDRAQLLQTALARFEAFPEAGDRHQRAVVALEAGWAWLGCEDLLAAKQALRTAARLLPPVSQPEPFADWVRLGLVIAAQGDRAALEEAWSVVCRHGHAVPAGWLLALYAPVIANAWRQAGAPRDSEVLEQARYASVIADEPLVF